MLLYKVSPTLIVDPSITFTLILLVAISTLAIIPVVPVVASITVLPVLKSVTLAKLMM